MSLTRRALVQYLLTCGLALLWLAWAAWPRAAAAQETTAPAIVDPAVTYVFGDHVLFQARLLTAVSPISGQVFFDAEGGARTWIGELTVSSQADGEYALEYLFNPTGQGLRTFVEVRYTFEIKLQDGTSLRSEPASFRYDDNRFTWQTLDEAPFRVHWYLGDTAFAQSVLDAAQSGLERAASLLLVERPEQVDIYVYASGADMQTTLTNNTLEWVAGHATTDLGVIVVSLPDTPEQPLLVQQRVPHELTHILVYNATGRGYLNLPTWLNEGLASNTELYPNPDYLLLLNKAYANSRLMPVVELCHSFPQDASGAILAYAESAYFTRYLHTTYGASALQTLVEQYANGVNCETGVLKVLGLNLVEVERGWRQELFGEQPLQVATTNLAPWAIILGAALGAPMLLIFAGLLRRPRQRSTANHSQPG